MTNLARQLLELTYIVIGCQFLHTAYCSYKDKANPVRYGTAGFWALLGISLLVVPIYHLSVLELS